ncbi:SDR family NAD(P)-dependent oxidoreductase [archaeon]
MADENVLVTGGAGFIGSHLVQRLVSEGYKVRVLDNLIRSTTTRIQPLIDDGKVEFIDGDVRYEDAVNKAIDGIDYVFHEAAVCINRSIAHPKESMDINLNGSHNVFRAALDNGVKRVVFASSASVYGAPEKLPMSESDDLKPITPYCVAKLSSEYLLKFFARQGLEYNVLRYFNVYGVGQKTDAYYTSVIIKFIKRLLAGEAPLISGDGSQSMDFVNVLDIVEANMLAMKSETKNEVMNVGSGTSVSIKELADIITKDLGLDIEPEYLKREVIVKERRADVSKIKKLLGFEPKVSIDEGLAMLVEDIKKNPQLY